jgi:hypothetical protein
MEAFVAFTSAKWAGVDIPEFKTQSKSFAAVLAARNICKRADLNASLKALSDARAAVRKFDRDVAAYREKIIGGASSIVGALELTRDTSFAVAEVIATATITAKTGNPKLAQASSAAIFGAIKSGATEIGEHLADPKRTWSQSAKNIVVDTAVATGASAIQSGIKADFITKLSGKVAPKVATEKTLKVLGVKATQEVVEKWLDWAGQKFIKDAMSQALKAGGDMAKKGRMLTAQEARQQMYELSITYVGGLIVKRFEGATWKYCRNLESTLVDGKAAKLGEWFQKLGNAQRAKVIHDIFTKNQDEIIKFGLQDVKDWNFPDMSEEAIAKKAEQVALKNKKLIELLTKEVDKSQKNGKK